MKNALAYVRVKGTDSMNRVSLYGTGEPIEIQFHQFIQFYWKLSINHNHLLLVNTVRFWMKYI